MLSHRSTVQASRAARLLGHRRVTSVALARRSVVAAAAPSPAPPACTLRCLVRHQPLLRCPCLYKACWAFPDVQVQVAKVLLLADQVALLLVPSGWAKHTLRAQHSTMCLLCALRQRRPVTRSDSRRVQLSWPPTASWPAVQLVAHARAVQAGCHEHGRVARVMRTLRSPTCRQSFRLPVCVAAAPAHRALKLAPLALDQCQLSAIPAAHHSFPDDHAAPHARDHLRTASHAALRGSCAAHTALGRCRVAMVEACRRRGGQTAQSLLNARARLSRDGGA